MPHGAATLTVEGAILYCNRHFADLLGRTLASLLGASIHPFVRPASRPLFEALPARAQAAGTQGEVTLQRGDGTEVPVYLGVNALREGAVGLCLMVTDLTQQKRHEALVVAEVLTRSVLEQVLDVIVVCDESGKVIRACDTACELAGRNPLLEPFEARIPAPCARATRAACRRSRWLPSCAAPPCAGWRHAWSARTVRRFTCSSAPARCAIAAGTSSAASSP